MQKFTRHAQFDLITWLLTGLIVLVGSYSILPAEKEAVRCEQERLTEIEADDDKQDLHDLGWTLDLPNNHILASESWQDVVVFFLVRPCLLDVHEHLGRGPPYC